MKTVTPGHLYLLDNFNEETAPRQHLQFIHKVEIQGKFSTVHNGTTNEDVLAVLIDRLEFLNKKAPHPDNEVALEGLKTALAALNHRTEERKRRGVEGTSAQ